MHTLCVYIYTYIYIYIYIHINKHRDCPSVYCSAFTRLYHIAPSLWSLT